MSHKADGEEEEEDMGKCRKYICEKICLHLAFITAFHHRDVQIYRRWRGIVYLCDPELSFSGKGGDASSFARAMWDRWNCFGTNAVVDRQKDLDFAYEGLFRAFNHMRNHVGREKNRTPNRKMIGAVQEWRQLASDMAWMEEKLTRLHKAIKEKQKDLMKGTPDNEQQFWLPHTHQQPMYYYCYGQPVYYYY
jgi:hypothetical protein